MASNPTSQGKVELLKLELDSLQSVREGAAEFLKRSKQLNVLINNAGMLASRRFFKQGPWCGAYLILSVRCWHPLLHWRLGRLNENIAVETCRKVKTDVVMSVVTLLLLR